MRRARLAMSGGVVAAAAAAAVAVAQQPAPTVAVTAGPASVAVQAAGAVPAGPTRFDVTRQGNRGLSVYFVLLNAGVTQQELEAALARDDRNGTLTSIGLVSIQGSVVLSGRDAKREVTFTLKPGLTYLVISETDEEPRGRAKPRGIATFTTSATANGAAAATPDATVRMVNLRFRGDSVLPRQGVVRVRNDDAVPHFAIAFPLRRGVTAQQFGRALRSNNERSLARVVSGAPVEVQNIISGGGVANDQPIRFTRAGRYGLVCFFTEHHRVGMSRVVTVR